MNMRILFLNVLLCFYVAANAQQTLFEGIVDFQLEVKSKVPGISDESMRRLVAVGPIMKVYIKHGNYRRESAPLLELQRSDSATAFFIFKGIDTLYHNSSTKNEDELVSITKSEKTIDVAGRKCKSLTIRRKKSTVTYYYDPQLFQDTAHANPKDESDYALFLKETKAVYLKCVMDCEQFVYTETAYRVATVKVNDAQFELPSLPVALFNMESHIKSAYYKKEDESEWRNYILKNMNADLANKYVKIPKGATEAQQTAQLQFTILANGTIDNIEVINPKEVHPQLAKEAIRIVKESYGWKPATIRGEKVDSKYKQNITFRLTTN